MEICIDIDAVTQSTNWVRFLCPTRHK